MRTESHGQVATFAMQSVGTAVTIVLGAALFGAFAARQDESWTRTLSIGACGAAVLAWLAAYSAYGTPPWTSLLIGALCGALIVAEFVRSRGTVTDHDAVLIATRVLMLMIALLATRNGAQAWFDRSSGGPTARPKVGAFRKL